MKPACHTAKRNGSLRRRAAAGVLLAALLAAGCVTDQEVDQRMFEMRAVKYPSAFPETERARLQRGEVHPGDTQEMVWIARGDPARKGSRVAAGQTNELWSYRQTVRTAELPSRGAGPWRPMILAGGRTVWVRDPLAASGEVVREIEVLRVEFASNRVVSVESPAPPANANP